MKGESLSVVPARDRQAVTRSGLRNALRSTRDPLLFGALPLAYAVSALMSAYDVVGMVGFDFADVVATRAAWLDGAAIYQAGTRCDRAWESWRSTRR